MANPLPIPIYDAMVIAPANNPPDRRDTSAYHISNLWIQWLTQLNQSVQSSPQKLQSVVLTTQGASITTTQLNLGSTTGGMYRLTWYARITRAASSSSSLTVKLLWTDGGVALTNSGTAITGNTTSTFQSGTITVKVDAATAINYATTYSSTGGTSMQYSLNVVLEQLAI